MLRSWALLLSTQPSRQHQSPIIERRLSHILHSSPPAPGHFLSPITWVQPNKIHILPTASDVGTAAGSFPVDKARLLRRQLCRRLTLPPRIEDGFLESCPSDLSAFPIQTSPLKNPPASDRERSLLVCCLFENRRPLGAYNWVQRRPWGQLAPLISSRI